MAAIESVSGPVDVDRLGVTLIHEHVRFSDDAVRAQWPHLYNADFEYQRALGAVRGAQAHGVRTIVEPTAMYGGRDVGFMRRVAAETGIQLIACTGIYTYDHLPHYFISRDADHMADCFVHDIEVGIQGTEARAAFIKCAADQQGLSDNVEKCVRAAAKASARTGRPIMAHSHPATGTGLEQIRIFDEEGVDLSKVQVAHTGDTDDLDHIEHLLDKGVYIGMDRFGLELYFPLEKRIATVTALLERGYAERMFLGADSCATIDWFPQPTQEQLMEGGLVNPKWSPAFVFEDVIPALREAGMSDDQLRTMMEENPRVWLS